MPCVHGTLAEEGERCGWRHGWSLEHRAIGPLIDERGPQQHRTVTHHG